MFFQQVAAGLEAVSNTWNFNAYALVPVGETEHRLNSHYNGGALDTFGLNVGYFITPEINASVGYYYQQGDLGSADGSGVKGRLAFAVAKGVEFGGTYTYDNAFNARASADLTVRFGGGSHREKSKGSAKAEQQPQIKALTAATTNRDVRVHDDFIGDNGLLTEICLYNPNANTGGKKTVNILYEGDRICPKTIKGHYLKVHRSSHERQSDGFCKLVKKGGIDCTKEKH